MSARLFDLGRQAFLNALVDFSGASIKSKLLDVSTNDTWLLTGISVTGAASPITVTKTAHGFNNGDVVVIGGVGGNLAANQLAVVANKTANTFDIQTLTRSTALAMTGSAAYTSGGWALNLTQAQFLADVDGSSVGTDVALAGKSITNGVANASAWTHVAVPSQANAVVAFILYKDTGAAGTSNLVFWNDGKTQVVVDKTVAATDTTVFVEPLAGPIASGAALVFSNGVTLTLSAPAVFGDRTLTVTSAPAIIAAGHTADALVSGVGLPVIPNGGSITITPASTAQNAIFKL